MADTQLVACPFCAALNRVPPDRQREKPSCGRCHEALFVGRPIPLDEKAFALHAERSQVPLLVDFWAPWCGPCVQMAPQFERAAAELEPAFRLGKVDTQAHPELGQRFAIRSIPTLSLFVGGAEVARYLGAISTREIVAWVRSQPAG